ncbi:Protein CLT3, chloroplastic [Linum grandiflorum]
MTSLCRRLTASSAPAEFLRRHDSRSSATVEVVSLPVRRIRNYQLQREISLRAASRNSKLFIVHTAVGGRSGVKERSDGGNEADDSAIPLSQSVDDSATGDAVERSEFGDLDTLDVDDDVAEAVEEKRIASSSGENRTVEVAIAAAATVVLGVGNRVLYKLALVPLKQYPFFLAQLATFGYVLVYFTILHFRHQAGIITNEMLSLPKGPFVLVGILEALGAAAGMAAGGNRCDHFSPSCCIASLYVKQLSCSSRPKFANLSGASIPVLSQTFLVWQILMSFVFLGRRYKVNQLLGCFLVAAGVIITVASGSSAGHSLKPTAILWSLLMILSFLFQAADTVLKEIIFLKARNRLKGGSLDIFVVNSFGSAYQALFICLLVPFMSKLWGIPFSQLPSYLKDGAACFLNIGALSSGCEGAPVLPLLFILVNMGFNISLLHLLKISSAVVSSLASTFSVPIAVYMFTLPLPYIGVASPLPKGFVGGAIILVLGLLVYSWTPHNTQPPSAASSTS